LHVPSADLEHGDVGGDDLDMPGINDLRNGGKSRLRGRGDDPRQRVDTGTLEGVGRCSWFEGTTSKHGRTGIPDCAGGRLHHVQAFSRAGTGDDDELAAPNCAAIIDSYEARLVLVEW